MWHLKKKISLFNVHRYFIKWTIKKVGFRCTLIPPIKSPCAKIKIPCLVILSKNSQPELATYPHSPPHPPPKKKRKEKTFTPFHHFKSKYPNLLRLWNVKAQFKMLIMKSKLFFIPHPGSRAWPLLLRGGSCSPTDALWCARRTLPCLQN